MKLNPWLILIGNCPPLVGIQTIFRGNAAAINRTSLLEFLDVIQLVGKTVLAVKQQW